MAAAERWRTPPPGERLAGRLTAPVPPARVTARTTAVIGWPVTNAGPAGLRLLRKPAVVAALAAQGVAIVRGANPPGQTRPPER